MRETFRDYCRDIVRKPQFWIPWILLSVTGHLPSLVNTKLHFEDLLRDRYTGQAGVMWSGRWGFVLYEKLFAFHEVNDIWEKCLALLLLLLASLAIGCLFYRVDAQKEKIAKYVVCCAGIVSFPLIAEIWNYNGANFVTCCNLLIVSLVLLFFESSEINYGLKLLITIFPMALVASSYEAALFSYVFLVLFFLWYQSRTGKSFGELMRKGVQLAIPLVLGIIMGTAIGHVICRLRGIPYYRNGATSIAWLHEDFSIKLFIKSMLEKYFIRGAVYFPIAVLAGCIIIFVVMVIADCIRRKNPESLLWGAFAFVSVFLQGLIQGTAMPYRTAQAVALFSGLTFFLILECLSARKHLFYVALLALLFLCFRQSAYLNNLNLLTYKLASQEERLIAQTGSALYAEHYGKPVLFPVISWEEEKARDFYAMKEMKPGNGFLSEAYLNLHEKWFGEDVHDVTYTETVYRSALSVCMTDADMMEQYFNYCGYPITVLDNGNLPSEYVETQILIDFGELHRYEIRDMGEYVVVVF
ncbi:MAG: glucosyltransferase domain-containing protein [Lachnospiraceae bacterium]|nr:glucosyltransferase domain-containing protein [Lachnospiraceae bacterium]